MFLNGRRFNYVLNDPTPVTTPPEQQGHKVRLVAPKLGETSKLWARLNWQKLSEVQLLGMPFFAVCVDIDKFTFCDIDVELGSKNYNIVI